MIGWTKVLVAACLVSGVVAMGQGDPARAFDAATAAVRPAGTKVQDRSDWGFDADGPCWVWSGVLRELYGGSGLREYGERWGEYEDVS